MYTFISCFCSVLKPTNHVNYKERSISTPAFGNNAIPFCQNTLSHIYTGFQPALDIVVKDAVGIATTWLLVQSSSMSTNYQLAFLAIL